MLLLEIIHPPHSSAQVINVSHCYVHAKISYLSQPLRNSCFCVDYLLLCNCNCISLRTANITQAVFHIQYQNVYHYDKTCYISLAQSQWCQTCLNYLSPICYNVFMRATWSSRDSKKRIGRGYHFEGKISVRAALLPAFEGSGPFEFRSESFKSVCYPSAVRNLEIKKIWILLLCKR